MTLNECGQASTLTASAKFDPEKLEQNLVKLRECIVGKKFPSFSATTVIGISYSNINLQDKVVLVNLWFTSCAPCVAEIPMLNDLNKKYENEEFLIISFSTDEKEAISKFLSKKPIDYDIIPSSKEFIEKKNKIAYGYPTNIILNKKGEIVEYQSGGPSDVIGLEKTKNEFIEIIERELAN